MFVMNKNRTEIVDVNVSGRIFLRNGTVCSGGTEGKPSYLGDYESSELAIVAIEMLFEAIGNLRISTYRMPTDREIKAKIANLPPEPESRLINGKKQKGHGRS